MARSRFLATAKPFAKNVKFCGFDLRITVGALTIGALTIKITNFVVEDNTKFACAYLRAQYAEIIFPKYCIA